MKWPVFLLIVTACAQFHPTNASYRLPEVSEPQRLTNVSLTCHDIRTQPRIDQCSFAHNHCEDFKIGFVNYVQWYYCSSVRIPTVVLFLLTLVSLFTTLGITASEFLCPNLDTIAKFFQLSESLAGVTLLALGNGAPDVFSTLEAIKIGSTNLAIGELIGAALFITGVVVGSMAIVRPFKVAKRPFIRDVTFLLVCVLLTATFLADGEISLMEATWMIVLYCIYVVFVVCWDWIVTKRRKLELLDQKIRNQFFDGSSTSQLPSFQVREQNEINDADLLEEMNPTGSAGIHVLDEQLQRESLNSFDEWTRRSTINKYRSSILSALDLNMRAAEFPQPTSGISLDTFPEQPPLRSTTTEIRMSSAPEFTDNGPIDEELTLGEYEQRTQSAPATYTTFEDNQHNTDEIRIKDWSGRNLLWNKDGINSLFPTLTNLREKPISDQCISVICLPVVTMLKLTIPVVPTSETRQLEAKTMFGKEFFILVTQCIIAPFVGMVLMCYDDSLNWRFFVIPPMISLGLLALSFWCRSLQRGHDDHMTKWYCIILSILGFIISILWISTIAAELIAIIKFFAVLLDLSDVILGITVFAIGNSLGDFISNFTIAKMGYPIMALSACFGGPMLNILLGIGGSALYVIPNTGENIKVDFSGTLIVTGATLVINLVALLIVVPMHRWEMNRQIGMGMIGLWCSATLVSCILELT